MAVGARHMDGKDKYFLKVSQLNKKDLLAKIFKILDKTFNVLFFYFYLSTAISRKVKSSITFKYSILVSLNQNYNHMDNLMYLKIIPLNLFLRNVSLCMTS